MTSVHEPDTATPVTAPPEAAARPPRRRRGRDTLVIVLVAVVCAVAAGAAVRQARGPALLVATAATDLRQGTRLDPSDLAWTEVRVSEEVAATLVSRPRADALAGWVLAGNVAAGQLLAASSLVEPAARSELRAMSVPLPVERAVAGDLRVGDRVDVLAATATASGYIAADVAVLAVGSPTTGGIGAGAWSVTLAVDDVTALAVAQALEGGSVHVTRATGAAPAEVDLRVLGVGADEPTGDGDADG